MNIACSLAWRLLLAVALVANPLIGSADSARANAAVQVPPCPDMAMAGDTMRSLPAAGELDQKPPCDGEGCPASICGSACEMGACVGHCVYLMHAVALPVWGGADAQLAPKPDRNTRPPLFAPLIRPPIA